MAVAGGSASHPGQEGGAEAGRVIAGSRIDGQMLLVGGWVLAVAIAVTFVRQVTLASPDASCLRELGAGAGTALPSSPTTLQLQAVSCELEHNYEVLAVTQAPFDLAASMPPDGNLGPEVHATCEQAYEKIFRRSSAGQAIHLVVFGPDPVGWIKLDREVKCAVFDSANPRQLGSYQLGTARAP
jgi:hypothetical protein